jgi:hypothetical protein
MSQLVEFLKRQLFRWKVCRELLPRAELHKEDVGLVIEPGGGDEMSTSWAVFREFGERGALVEVSVHIFRDLAGAGVIIWRVCKAQLLLDIIDFLLLVLDEGPALLAHGWRECAVL